MPRTAMQAAMARKGYSYRTLGFLTDLDAGYLCRVAHGKRRLSRPAAVKVATALQIAPRRLRGSEGVSNG